MVMEAKAMGAGSPKADTEMRAANRSDVYFSVDIETDGPIPGPFSMLSFAIVPAGVIRDGCFVRSGQDVETLYRELKPISEHFEPEALAVNGLDRKRLVNEGLEAAEAMKQASEFIHQHALGGVPVLVAYPLSFDWSFLYWYFIRFGGTSPFKHSRCFDMKTAIAVKGKRAIAKSGHAHLPESLLSSFPHTHNALDDAVSQADVFANLMEWDGT